MFPSNPLEDIEQASENDGQYGGGRSSLFCSTILNLLTLSSLFLLRYITGSVHQKLSGSGARRADAGEGRHSSC